MPTDCGAATLDSDDGTDKWSAKETSGSAYYSGSSCYLECSDTGTVKI